MHTLILVLHVVAGSLMIVSSLLVFFAALGTSVSRNYYVMLASFSATIVSGIGLLFIGAGIGRICAGMAISTAAVMIVRHFYLRRLAVATTV